MGFPTKRLSTDLPPLQEEVAPMRFQVLTLTLVTA